MKLINITLLCGALALAGCNASTELTISTDSNDSPAADEPVTGSITLDSDPTLILQPLPEVSYNPALTPDRGDGGGTTGVAMLEDGAATSDASAPTTGRGDTGGSTDGGSGTTGGDTGGTTGAGDIAGTTGGSVSAPESEGLPITSDSDVIAHPPIRDDQFQAGTLTAADYDDHLNPHLYQRYASDYLQRVGGKLDVPYLDLSNRIVINVNDQSGNRYRGATLEFSDGNNVVLTLRTPASGTTYLYTDIDWLPEQFTLRASERYGTAVDQQLTLTDVKNAGVINITLPVTLPDQDLPQETAILDVMFVVDTTGSMGDELDYLQTELTPIIDAIPYDKSLLNLGLTFYRDIGDQYVVRAHGFTNDIGRAQQTLNNESFGGGGDYPEAMDQALHQAIDANWSENSKRILFLIADAPPHSDKMRATWQAAEQARKKNIHIVPIAASGVGEDAEYLMRSVAAFTNSRYLFLTDDSGYGNPHAEPDVDCYVVTHLNNLMIRVMNSLIFGERDEPSDNDIIRRVGHYDNGVCRTVQPNQQ